MPYARNQKAHIHYEVEGEGPPLVLVHGLAGTLGDWRGMGYAAALNSDYRLILIDVRGCGASAKLYDLADYRPELIAGDIVAVLDDLGIDKAHYMG